MAAVPMPLSWVPYESPCSIQVFFGGGAPLSALHFQAGHWL